MHLFLALLILAICLAGFVCTLVALPWWMSALTLACLAAAWFFADSEP
jgi:hypothetical protein